MTTTTTVQVHLPKMLHKDLLFEHPRNSNKQNRHMFKELRDSIREHGFDESLLVVPKDEGDGYWVVSGNHRYRAGCAEGMEEFPCVIRNDWTDIDHQIQLIRRNYVRGNIDKDAFTVAVNTLAQENNLPLDDIRESLGFEDADIFMQYYKEEEERQQAIGKASTSAPQVKMIDDLGLVLSSIFERYGDTVPSSFLIFPAGGKKHMFVAATPAVVRIMQELATYSLENHIDLNLVLGGILAIGKENSHLGKKEETTKEELVEKQAGITGTAEFTPLGDEDDTNT